MSTKVDVIFEQSPYPYTFLPDSELFCDSWYFYTSRLNLNATFI